MRHARMNKRALGESPTAEQVRLAREAAGLTQTQAGLAVFRSLRTWQKWEGGERRMSPESFCLFLLLTKQVSIKDVRAASMIFRGQVEAA